MSARRSSKAKNKNLMVKLNRWFDKQNKYKLVLIAVVALAILAFPVSTTAEKTVTIPYKTKIVQDSSIELGSSQVNQAGDVGQGLKKNRNLKPFFFFITGIGFRYTSSPLPTEITQPSADRVIAHGTKKFQYMLCSDGTYSYYTNSQFSNPNVGFTHKSPDTCAKTGHGHVSGLSDVAPQQTTTYTPSYIPTPTYTHCSPYSDFVGFSCTTF